MKKRAVSKKKAGGVKRAATIAKDHPRKKAKSSAILKKERLQADLSIASTHKARAAWFRAREAWPLRESPVVSLLRERNRVELAAANHPGAAGWKEAGPTNVGGRSTSIVVHALDSSRIVLGAAGGGVWTSDDGGKNWVSRWHREPTLNIGSLATDPSNPDIVYCGTGEANLSADSHAGVGMYRSLDFGISWHLLAAADVNGLPRRIGAIAVDPNEASRVLIGGVNHMAGMPTGMFGSVNGGMTWSRIAIVPDPYRCFAILFHPTREGWVYATIDSGGDQSGVWMSKDSGVSWIQLRRGMPSGSFFGRASLAMAPSNPDTLYSLVSARDNSVLGVYKSTNAGRTWKNMTGKHFGDERQMSYNNAIAVHPNDSNLVVCGGVDIHRTTDGGRNWKKMTRWFADRDERDYAHADQHGFCMPSDPAGLIYAVNDGGLDVSPDGGVNWVNRSNGLATNMFYDLEVAVSEPKFYGGGAQDNGTIVTFDASPELFTEIMGGDGGWLALDPVKPFRHFFTNAQFMVVYRYRSSDTDPWTDVSPPESRENKPWMAITTMDPSNSKTVYCCSNAVWKTTNDAKAWKRVSPRFDRSTITGFEVCRADTSRLYVGTENGNIFRSEDGGRTWSQNLSNSTIPGFTVTHIKSDPSNADRIFITVANFGSAHVFRSDDAGLNWIDVDNGDLPDVPHHSIAIPKAKPRTIYVSNDVGVFVSTNSGGSWRNLTGNLPNSPVIDIVYHDVSNYLTAATYGRSMWRIKL